MARWQCNKPRDNYRDDGYNNVCGEDVQKSMLRIDVKYNDERRKIVMTMMTSSVMMMILDGDNS